MQVIKSVSHRFYEVKVESGGVLRRNRRHLRRNQSTHYACTNKGCGTNTRRECDREGPGKRTTPYNYKVRSPGDQILLPGRLYPVMILWFQDLYDDFKKMFVVYCSVNMLLLHIVKKKDKDVLIYSSKKREQEKCNVYAQIFGL